MGHLAHCIEPQSIDLFIRSKRRRFETFPTSGRS